MGVRGRLLMLALGVALPLALAGAVTLRGLWTASRQQLDRSLQQQAEVAAVSLERWVDAQQRQLTTVARYAVARRASAPAAETLRVTATSLTWVDVRVVDPEGRTEIAEPTDAEPLPVELAAELFDDVRRRRMWAVGTEPQTSETARPALALGAPLENDRIAVARVNRSAVGEFFRNVEPGGGELFAVFDSRGRIIYRSHLVRKSEAVAASGAPILEALGDRPATVVEIVSPLDGVRRVYGLARAGSANLVVAVGMPSATVHAPARRQFASYVLFSSAALACAVAAALLIAKGIARPLLDLKSAVRSFGEGDASARADVKGATEVAELSLAFNRMAAHTEEREARLEELDRLKSEFIGNVSHELRTPLTTIKTLTRVMLSADSRENQREEYLRSIAAACDRQINLVANLLDLSKLEAGTFDVTPARTDAAEIARACLLSSRFAADARGQELRAELPDDLPFVRADYRALRRVLCELVESGLKYTPDGGRIVVSARAETDVVAISVADTGRGIRPEDVPHIFGKFYRGRSASESDAGGGNSPSAGSDDPGDAEEQAEVPGLGLGLYIARRLVELMNGTISVESTPGQGSTFTVRLPVWRDGGEASSPSERTENG